jgi:GTP-binding protein YchF
MRVALIGPPYSGKSTLFAAVGEAGGSHIDISRPDQPHLAVVKVPDERLVWLSELYKPEKTTFAELEFLDLPGMDLTDDGTRAKSRQHWAAMRQSDMLVAVVRGFASDSVPPYRDRVNPESDAEELQGEMLFADLDGVMNRVERLEAQIKKPVNRTALQKELGLMQRLQDALENEQPIRSAVKNAEEEKAIRSFAFLSLKPQLIVINCDEDAAAEPVSEPVAGQEAMRLSANLELDLARLSPEDRQAFLEDLSLDSCAGERLVRACYHKLDLITMFTSGEDECKAWTLPAGCDAVTAAGAIHSDIARGFIRAETMSYADFRAANGDVKAVKAAGKTRLEGKEYVVQDGDIINFRFNV